MKSVLKWTAASVGLAISAALSALLFGYARFNQLVRRDVDRLFAQQRMAAEAVVTAEMLGDLPEPVRRYLTYAGIVGKTMVRSVHLQQKGKMRLGADQPWIPLDAEVHYTVEPPGFVWTGTMHLRPLPLARARDMYLDGHGAMLVKAGSLVPVVDARGPELDHGALMRYLDEMMWFPTAFLGDNVSFEPVDDTSARVTLTDRGRTVSGMMYFDVEGRLTNVVAQQYRTVGGGYELTTWSTPVVAYGEFEGLRLPVRGKGVWKLPGLDLEYVDLTVTDLRYNVAKP